MICLGRKFEHASLNLIAVFSKYDRSPVGGYATGDLWIIGVARDPKRDRRRKISNVILHNQRVATLDRYIKSQTRQRGSEWIG